MGFTAPSDFLPLAQLSGSQSHPLGHHLPGFEPHRCPSRYDNILFRLLGIPTNSGFGQTDLKNPEVSKLYIPTGCQGLGDGVKGLLNDSEYLLLDDSGILADLHHQITFGQVGYDIYRDT